jgi:hypothetical protein
MPLDSKKKIGAQSETTIAPLSELAARASHLDPEFVDCKGLEAGWGIKRSLAYSLLADGLIRGVSLRRRGQLRGKRLFDVASVRAFLRSQMEGCGNDGTAPVRRKSIKESR